MMLAAIRPGDWNLPLLVHVAGAMLLVGAVVVASLTAAAAVRSEAGAAVLSRTTSRILVVGALPAYLMMRAGAEWIAAMEEIASDPAWIGIGYATADGGLVLAAGAAVLAWRGGRGDRPAARAAAFGLCALTLVAYTTAIWAMTTRPG